MDIKGHLWLLQSYQSLSMNIIPWEEKVWTFIICNHGDNLKLKYQRTDQWTENTSKWAQSIHSGLRRAGLWQFWEDGDGFISRENTHTSSSYSMGVACGIFARHTHSDTQKVPCCSRRQLCSYDALGRAVSTLLCNWLSQPHINTISHVSNPIPGNMAVSMSAYVHVLSKDLCSQYQNHQTTVIIS